MNHAIRSTRYVILDSRNEDQTRARIMLPETSVGHELDDLEIQKPVSQGEVRCETKLSRKRLLRDVKYTRERDGRDITGLHRLLFFRCFFGLMRSWVTGLRSLPL